MKFRSVVLGLIAAIGLAGFGCWAEVLPAVGHSSFTTQEVRSERRFDVGDAYVSAKIVGKYPRSGSCLLVDSARWWIASLLMHAKMSEQPLFATPPELLQNGRMLVTRCRNALIRTSEAELMELGGGEWSMPHEFDISFVPTYNTEKLLTYVYTEYLYMGGAHGLMLRKAQTFVASTGARLTNEDVFLPEKREELISLIRNALWEQYFKKECPGGSLDDALLIEPAELDLPSDNPEFGSRGISFTYQEYEIAPYAAGLPRCTISYSDLRSVLKPEIVELLAQ